MPGYIQGEEQNKKSKTYHKYMIIYIKVDPGAARVAEIGKKAFLTYGTRQIGYPNGKKVNIHLYLLTIDARKGNLNSSSQEMESLI